MSIIAKKEAKITPAMNSPTLTASELSMLSKGLPPPPPTFPDFSDSSAAPVRLARDADEVVVVDDVVGNCNDVSVVTAVVVVDLEG